jgi:lipopolysaccharide transport system permease protein
MQKEQSIIVIRPKKSWWNVNWSEIWEYRELLYFFAWRDVKVRYKQTVIGAAWAIIQPFMTMIVFSLFFGRLVKISSEGLPYPIFYYSALLPWTYFATSLNRATEIIVENQNVIRKVYFPRLNLPLSAVISPLVDLGVALPVLFGLMLYYGFGISIKMLALPLFVLLAMLSALSVGIWLCGLNAIYRDVRYAVPFIIQLWMFGSPVVYPASIVPEKWRLLYGLNPMVGVIEGFRWMLVDKGTPPNIVLTVSTLAMLILLITGIMYFRRMESFIVDRV